MAGTLNALTTYAMNGSASALYERIRGYKLSNPSFKSTCILMWEPDDTQTATYNDGSNIPASASRRHLNGCLLMRLGGSTDFMKYERLSTLIHTVGPNDACISPNAPATGGWPNGSRPIASATRLLEHENLNGLVPAYHLVWHKPDLAKTSRLCLPNSGLRGGEFILGSTSSIQTNERDALPLINI